MTYEATSYNTLKANVFKFRDRVDRIENMVVTGMPDLSVTVEGHDSWIEVKSPRNEPSRASTPLLGSNHQLSQEQRNWLLNHAKAGGRAFVYIDSPSRRYLIDGRGADLINGATPTELMMTARWSATVPTANERWKELREILRGR